MVNASSGAGGTRVFSSVRFVREDTGEQYNTGVYVIPPADDDDIHGGNGPVRMMGMMGQRAEPRASPHRWGGTPDGSVPYPPLPVTRNTQQEMHTRVLSEGSLVDAPLCPNLVCMCFLCRSRGFRLGPLPCRTSRPS